MPLYTSNMSLWGKAKNYSKSSYGALTLSSLFATSLNFFTGLIIASSLGPFGRGTYQIVKNFQSLIPSLLNLSLGNFYSSGINKSKLGLSKYKIHVLIAWVVAVLILTKVPFYDPIPQATVLLIALTFPAYFTSNLVTAIFLRDGKINYYLRYFWIANVGTPMMIITFHLVGDLTFYRLILALVIPVTLNLIWSARYLRVNHSSSKSIYSQIGKVAIVHFSSFSRILISLSDQLVIASLIGIANLGIYMVAYSFASIFAIFTSPANSLVPVWCKNPELMKRRKRQYLILVICTSIFSIFIAPKLLNFIVLAFLNSHFLQVTAIFPKICVGILFSAFNEFLLAEAIYNGRSRLLILEKLLHFLSILLFVVLISQNKSLEFQSFFILATCVPSFILLLTQSYFYEIDGRKYEDL